MREPDSARETGPRAQGEALKRLDDLHDQVIQTLFGVGLTLQAAAATAGEATLAVRLEEAAANLAGVVRDLREYAATHDVDRLEPHEAEQVIRALARELAAAGGVRLGLQIDPAAAVALAGCSYPLIEMVAALLAGLARQRGAGQGTIRLRRGRRWVRLDITAEGSGTRPAPGWSRGERLQLRADAARLGCHLAFVNEAGPVARATLRMPSPPGR